MMHMAKVVFSNGSKAMAHNLDDQYQRWQMRREELTKKNPEVNPELGVEEFVPELPKINTYQEAKDYAKVLADKQVYLQHEQAVLNMSYQSNELIRHEYELKRAPLSVAVYRINLQNRELKRLMQTKPQSGHRIRELKDKRNKEGLSTYEEIELNELRFSETERSLDGAGKWVEQAVDDGDREVRQQKFIEDIRKELIETQRKLIAAYERIIELGDQEH